MNGSKGKKTKELKIKGEKIKTEKIKKIKIKEKKVKEKRIELRTNLIVAFGNMLVLMAIITVVAVFRLNQINNSMNDIVNKYNKKVEISNNMIQDANQIIINTRNILVSNGNYFLQSERVEVENNSSKYDKDKKNLEKLLVLESERSSFEVLKSKDEAAIKMIKEVATEGITSTIAASRLASLIEDLKKPESEWLASINAIFKPPPARVRTETRTKLQPSRLREQPPADHDVNSIFLTPMENPNRNRKNGQEVV